MLREEELTLVKALRICRADEQSNKQLKAMNTGDVHAIRKSKEPKGEKDHFKRNASARILRNVTINNRTIHSIASIVENHMHRSSAQHSERNVITVERTIIALKSVERRKYLVLNRTKKANT